MTAQQRTTDLAMPANDTDVPRVLPVGGTFETPAWRVHRFADSVHLTHVLHAGERGKKCLEIVIGTSFGKDARLLDLLVSHLLLVAIENPTPETLAEVARETSKISRAFELTISAKRGVDVETRAVKVESDLVQAHFSAIDFRITVTALHKGPHGTIRHDSHLYNHDRRSAEKAYLWARANAARIGSMTRSELYSALTEAGARVDTWG